MANSRQDFAVVIMPVHAVHVSHLHRRTKRRPHVGDDLAKQIGWTTKQNMNGVMNFDVIE